MSRHNIALLATYSRSKSDSQCNMFDPKAAHNNMRPSRSGSHELSSKLSRFEQWDNLSSSSQTPSINSVLISSSSHPLASHANDKLKIDIPTLRTLRRRLRMVIFIPFPLLRIWQLICDRSRPYQIVLVPWLSIYRQGRLMLVANDLETSFLEMCGDIVDPSNLGEDDENYLEYK